MLRLPNERFHWRCFCCNSQYKVEEVETLYCGADSCVMSSRWHANRSLLVSLLPEWNQPGPIFARVDDRPPVDGLCARPGQRGQKPFDGLSQYLPFKTDHLGSKGFLLGNALLAESPENLVSQLASIPTTILDLSGYNYSGTLKDPRSWAIINCAIEGRKRDLVVWTAGNAGLSLARLANHANEFLPPSDRLQVLAVEGPNTRLDTTIRSNLARWGAAVHGAIAHGIYSSKELRGLTGAGQESFWDVTDGFESVGLVMYRLLLLQAIVRSEPTHLFVPVGTGNLAVAAILAARDAKALGIKTKVVGGIPSGTNIRTQIERQLHPRSNPSEMRPARLRPCMPKITGEYTPLLPCIDVAMRRRELDFVEVDAASQRFVGEALYAAKILCEPSGIAAFAAAAKKVTAVETGEDSRFLIVSTGFGVLSSKEIQYFWRLWRRR